MNQKFLDNCKRQQEHIQTLSAQTRDFSVPGFDEPLTFRHLANEQLLDYGERFTEARGVDKKKGYSRTLAVYNLFTELIFYCCPAFQDAELQAALGVADPMDVVRTCIGSVDVLNLGTELITWMGIVNSPNEDDKTEDKPPLSA